MVALYFQVFISLFSILNPLSVIPLYLDVTSDLNATDKKLVAATCGGCVFIILFGSLFLGKPFMSVFNIHNYSLRLAGGIIVLLIGISMVLSPTQDKHKHEQTYSKEKVKSLGVSPMAFPMLVGPATIVLVMLYGQQHPSFIAKASISLAIFSASIAVVAVLSLGNFIAKILGPIGLLVVNKIMGLIFASIALELIVSGLKSVVPILVAAAHNTM